jgi:MSHA biogenesis protein MshK
VFKIITLLILVCGFACSITQVVADTDPTRPFGHSATSSVAPNGKKLVLESIIHGDGIHTVVISGKVLKPFEYIGEYQLTAVNEQSVILRSKTTRLKLDIFKSNVVKIKFTSEKVLAKNP